MKRSGADTPSSSAGYSLEYHPAVSTHDLPGIPANLRERIAKAIRERLTTAPEQYGSPLRRNLKSCWKLRGGDYRVVFQIPGRTVMILMIRHRKEVYDLAPSRLS